VVVCAFCFVLCFKLMGIIIVLRGFICLCFWCCLCCVVYLCWLFCCFRVVCDVIIIYLFDLCVCLVVWCVGFSAAYVCVWRSSASCVSGVFVLFLFVCLDLLCLLISCVVEICSSLGFVVVGLRGFWVIIVLPLFVCLWVLDLCFICGCLVGFLFAVC